MWRPEPLDKNKKWSNSISRVIRDYLEISKNLKLARFKLAYFIETYEEKNTLQKTSLNDLWEQHQRYYSFFRKIYSKKKAAPDPDTFKSYYQKINASKTPRRSLLDLKLEIAEKISESCYLCEKRCGVNRKSRFFDKSGYCNCQKPVIASEFLHIGEEAPLIPSHTIFFTGCTLHCVFCQNWNISQRINAGIHLSERKLASIIDARRKQGSINVNFVGGEPTPHLPFIIRTLSYCKENLPVIWNSNFFMSEESMWILQGFVDLYLSDFKFGNDECASHLCAADNYWNTITRNHLMANESGNLIIRHLILPGHVECCTKPILSWIAEHLGPDTVVNIMGQYHPDYYAHQYPEISRIPFSSEIEEAVRWAKKVGLKNLI